MIPNNIHIAVSLDLGTSILSSVRALDASNLVLKARHEVERIRAESQRLQIVQVWSQIETAHAAIKKLKVQQMVQVPQVQTAHAAIEKLKVQQMVQVPQVQTAHAAIEKLRLSINA